MSLNSYPVCLAAPLRFRAFPSRAWERLLSPSLAFSPSLIFSDLRRRARRLAELTFAGLDVLLRSRTELDEREQVRSPADLPLTSR